MSEPTPTEVPEEVAEPTPAEGVREVAREVVEEARKIASALRELGRRLESTDIPKLVRSVLLLAYMGMTLYVSGVAVATMLPHAAPVFAQLGFLLGYMVPLMFMATMLSIVVGLARTLIK